MAAPGTNPTTTRARPDRAQVRRRTLTAIAIAGTFALTACAENRAPEAAPAAAPPDAGVSQETVAWTGSVCSTLVPVATALENPPAVDLTDPAATKQAYAAYLDQALQQTEQALQQVTNTDPPPIQGGGEIIQNVRTQVTELRDDLAQARTQVEQADVNNPAALTDAVNAASNILESTGNRLQAVDAISQNEQLQPAYEQAQECEQLRTVASS